MNDELIFVRDPFNSVGRYTVTVKNGDIVVVHLPKKIRIKTLFFIFMERRKHYVHCHWKEEVLI